MWGSTRGLIVTGSLVIVLAAMTVITWTSGSETDSAPRDAAPAVADGQALFQTRGCIGCHTISLTASGGTVGPGLTGLPQVAATRVEGMTASDYVRQSIREPDAYTVQGYGPGVMPVLPLTDLEVDTLVEYLLERKP
ncbi:MAG: cytochrome c [Actinomycetota bacterium]